MDMTNLLVALHLVQLANIGVLYLIILILVQVVGLAQVGVLVVLNIVVRIL